MPTLREGTPRRAPPLSRRMDRLRVAVGITTTGRSRELNTIIMQMRRPTLITVMGEISDKEVVDSYMQEVLATPTLAVRVHRATLNWSLNN
jgi:hypothetical protein